MKRRIYVAVFLATFLLRMVFCIPVFMDFSKATGPGSDAKNYLALAEHILQKRQFTVYAEETGYREAARTPGYPLFIVLANLLSGGRAWFIVVLQCILEGLLACGIFAITASLLNRIVPAVTGAMLYAIHPHQALYVTQVFSEILFTLILFMSILAIILFIRKRRALLLLIAGGSLGIATLIRPISLYFAIPVVLIIIILLIKRFSLLIRSVALFLIAFFIVLSPWYIRNVMTFDRLFFSTIGNLNIGFYNAAFVVATNEGIPLKEAQELVAREVQERYGIPDERYQFASDDPEICAQIARYGLGVIRQHPGRYAALHAIGFIHVFMPMEYAFLYKVFGKSGVEKAREAKAISKGVLGDTLRGKFISLVRTVVNERFRKFPWWFTVVWITFSLFQLFVYIFALRGLARFWKEQRMLFLLFLLTIVYFAIIPGPVGDPRFRVPVEPLFAFMAGVGIWGMKANGKLKAKSKI